MVSHSEIKSTCSYCGVGCGVLIHRSANGNIEVKGDPDHPVNKGMLCSKGMNLHYVVQDHSDRLTQPMVRYGKSQPLQPVGWEEAMRRNAAVFKTLIKKYGPDSVGFYVSGQCLTEEYYLINKLCKGFIGTNNIDTNSRLCMSSAVVGYKKALGDDIVPIAYDDIELADTFLIAGANPAWCHPILFKRLEAHKKANPATKVVVIDPRVTQSVALADVHLQIYPGTDIVALNAIARILIETNQIDHSFIREHVNGFQSLKELVMGTTIEAAATQCGVAVTSLYAAANAIGNAKNFISMWAMGLNQSHEGVNNNLALLNLSLITGQIGRPGAGPFSLTGQPNAMGGREVGGMSNLLAAHLDQQNPAHRKQVAQFWGVEKLPVQPGKTATEMFEALKRGEMKAIWIVCTNPLVSLPDSNLVEEALQQAKYVVVQDISARADTLEYADAVLPAAGWAEKEGTMTNSERRITLLSKAIQAPGTAKPDTEIIMSFAKAMGYSGFDFPSTEAIYQEYCAQTKGTAVDISALSYAILKDKRSVQWPYSQQAKGVQRMFQDLQFCTADKKANVFAVAPTKNKEVLSSSFPYILTTGRVRDQWHTRTRTGKVNKLNQHLGEPFVQIHPEDAARLKVKENEALEIFNTRGKVQVLAQLSGAIKPGTVFIPMHWGKILGGSFARSNNLTANNIDPISKQPGFKYSAVGVRKFYKAKEKLLVVGAGAAAFRFLNTYRAFNTTDPIMVFSKEPEPFYNRVLLPEYLSEHLTWEQLVKFKKGAIKKLDIQLFVGCSILHIDKDKKIAIDSTGTTHEYDRLVLATGSSPFLPKDAPIDSEGVFTMRSKQDADALKLYAEKEDRALIIGGGLLGLELAASLNESGTEVTVVQLAARLMERQLDATSSMLLREHVEELGIDVFCNDQVQSILKKRNEKGYYIYLKSGTRMEVEIVVYAIGTRPNIGLAEKAGIATKRGVLVDEYLQTDADGIYAIGEIAEYNAILNGTTAAAEQQADVVAKSMNGDLNSWYNGSLSMNILKFSDLDLCSLGMVEVPLGAGQKDYEEIVFIDKAKRYYKKCIVKQDRLVGAILMGDKLEFAEFKTLIEQQIELSEKRLSLLRSGKKIEPVIGKLICSCNNVGDGNITQLVKNGCHVLNDLCNKSGAGLGCGSCKTEVQSILDLTLETEKVESS